MPLKPSEGTKISVPLVVLIGPDTTSAAEDFLIYCDELEQVTLVGQPTNGSTGQPIFFELPGGGSARVCAKRDYYPDGRDFVGCGVQPDVLVEPTVESFRSGTDLVLEKGLEVLREKIKESN